MNHERKLGDVDLGDYLGMVGAQRAKRRAKTLAAAGACVLAFAAGKFSPWPGKDTDKLTMQEALHLLDEHSPNDWQRELGAYSIFTHLVRGLDALAGLAGRGDKAGLDASLYLGSATILAAERFLPLSSPGSAGAPSTPEATQRAKELQPSLRRLRDTVKEQ